MYILFYNIQIQLDNLKNLILIGGQQGGIKEGTGKGTGYSFTLTQQYPQQLVSGDVVGVGIEDEGLKKRPLKKKVRDTW